MGRARWDAFYAGDPNDSELGRFPAVTHPLVFNEAEAAIDEHICAAMRGIQDLGLMCNEGELAHAVHTMQLFVIKHMLQRLGSPEFSHWYHTPEPPTFGAYGRMLQETAALAKAKASSSGQWCTLHNRHQDDPEHDYSYEACEGHMREATRDEERAVIKDMWANPDFPPW